jgi:hypothetical protein
MPEVQRPRPEYWADLATALWGDGHKITAPPDNALCAEALALEKEFVGMLISELATERWAGQATSPSEALYGCIVPVTTWRIPHIWIDTGSGTVTFDRKPVLSGLLVRPVAPTSPAALVAQASSAREAYEMARELGRAGTPGYTRDELRKLFNSTRE